jgi:isoquinoline 1-oxidoreductase beta subunit
MHCETSLTRRRLIFTSAAVAGGLALRVSFASETAEAADITSPVWYEPPGKNVLEFDPFLTIAPDDTVTVRVTTPEIGNGVMTQACMTVAEELQCDWSKMRAEFAEVNRNFRENGVYGKAGGLLAFFSGRSLWDDRLQLMLQVGASTRERLKAAAAAQWKVPAAEIDAANSILTHTPTGRRLRYGEVAAKAATVKLAAEPALKPRDQWTFLGKASPPKLNIPAIVTGTATYGMDIRLPGMVYAALRQSPVHGGKLKSCNADAVRSMPGVRAVVIVDPTEPRYEYPQATPLFGKGFANVQWGVAVIADHYWQARKALEALPVEWEDGPGGQWKSMDQIVAAAFATCDKPGKVELSVGTARDLVDKQTKVVEGSYYTPYCDNAVMEPLNGTALVTPDRVDCWLPNQFMDIAAYTAAGESGVKPENVYIHQTFVGGAFGRRGGGDDVRMVVAVAKKYPGVPVHVIWTREETMRQGRYRGLAAAKLKAGLDASGLPVAFVGHIAGKGPLNNTFHDNVYTNGCIPHIYIEQQDSPEHLLCGAFRGPGYNSYAFIMETFIDECAYAAGIDPMDYRLKLVAKWSDPGWTKCLKEVAAKSGWGRKLPKGQGQGVAICNWMMQGKPENGTTVACVATVEVTPAGVLVVKELDFAFDCGSMINEDAVVSQMQCGSLFALNVALNEELTVKDGRVVEGNFDDYPMLRTKDAPKVNIHFGGLTGHKRFGESGEPPNGPIGPAVGNAIYSAIGKRIRSTPFRKHDLSWT